MTIAVILIPVLVVACVAVYRNQLDTAHLSRVPFGFDREFGPDSNRIREELAILTRTDEVVAAQRHSALR